MSIELISVLVGLSLGAFGFGIAALVMSCMAWSTVVGLKNSTHQIQYVPIGEEDMQRSPEELRDEYERVTGEKYEEDEYV